MERRFAAVLHHVVRRLMDAAAPALAQLLAAGGAPGAEPDQAPAAAVGCRPPAAAAAALCEPFLAPLRAHLEFLAPALDPRVLRRAARELWNESAGVSGPAPSCCQHGRIGFTFKTAYACRTVAMLLSTRISILLSPACMRQAGRAGFLPGCSVELRQWHA